MTGDTVEVPRSRLKSLMPAFGMHCPECFERSFKTVSGRLACDECGNEWNRDAIDECLICGDALADDLDALCLSCFAAGRTPATVDPDPTPNES